jgi:hypothetical protein
MIATKTEFISIHIIIFSYIYMRILTIIINYTINKQIKLCFKYQISKNLDSLHKALRSTSECINLHCYHV